LPKLQLPKLACSDTVCVVKGRRFHWTCLTCPTRKLEYGKTTKWRRKKTVHYIGESINPCGSIVPAGKYYAYFVIIPIKDYEFERGNWHDLFKTVFIKKLLTFAEMLAQW